MYYHSKTPTVSHFLLPFEGGVWASTIWPSFESHICEIPKSLCTLIHLYVFSLPNLSIVSSVHFIFIRRAEVMLSHPHLNFFDSAFYLVEFPTQDNTKYPIGMPFYTPLNLEWFKVFFFLSFRILILFYGHKSVALQNDNLDSLGTFLWLKYIYNTI